MICLNGIVVKENKKRFFSFIKTEDTEYKGQVVRIYRIAKINKKIKKSLIKKLKNDNINKVAVERKLENGFNGQFDILKERDVLLENLPLVVKKGTGVLGIKKGKLKLGIVADSNQYILSKVNELKEILKTVYIYADSQSDILSWADSFFGDTGIPVVVRKNIEINQADILVIGGEKIYIPESDAKLILDFSGRNQGDFPKVKIPESIKKYDLSDWVIAAIFETGYHLGGFAKKSLTQSDKNNIII